MDVVKGGCDGCGEGSWMDMVEQGEWMWWRKVDECGGGGCLDVVEDTRGGGWTYVVKEGGMDHYCSNCI